jgi:hypothetical protein
MRPRRRCAISCSCSPRVRRETRSKFGCHLLVPFRRSRARGTLAARRPTSSRRMPRRGSLSRPEARPGRAPSATVASRRRVPVPTWPGICPSCGCDNRSVSNPDDRETRVSIRRAPKFSVFVVLGALLGVLASLILTASFPIDKTVGFAATFGYFAIYGFVAGILVGSIVALIFDRVLSRRSKSVDVTVDRLQVPDQESRD